MSIFKNYKCPNGLPPDECRHVPQLILNLANAYKKKKAHLKVNKTDMPGLKQTTVVANANKDRQRARSR